VDDVTSTSRPRAEHPDGDWLIGVLAVHEEMLADGVDSVVLAGRFDALDVDDILDDRPLESRAPNDG